MDPLATYAGAEQRVVERYGMSTRTRYPDLQVPRLRARILEIGDGAPLLLLHGGGGFAAGWAPLMAHLHGRRVIAARGVKRGIAFGEDELRRVGQPTLFLWGTRDPFGRPEVGRRAATLMADARLETTDAGHLPWLDAPDWCAARIVEHSAPRATEYVARHGPSGT